ncbi:unnamed protein product [Somion occarium]|uniref:DUF7770 domain-containing protein n=1 Tax=Somion occarium TaxID=3059160 RepID=A0ABP1DN78_9APHY
MILLTPRSRTYLHDQSSRSISTLNRDGLACLLNASAISINIARPPVSLSLQYYPARSIENMTRPLTTAAAIIPSSEPMPAMMPRHPRLSDAVLNASISEVNIWAPQAIRTFHWRTTLVLATTTDGFLGVSLDMYQPVEHVYKLPEQPQNSFGTLQITPRTERLLYSTRTFYKACSVPMVTKVTVNNVYDLIVELGLQHYMFHAIHSSGCMFWNLQLLRLFQLKRWVAEGSYEAARETIQHYHIQLGGIKVPWPPVEGKYYRFRDFDDVRVLEVRSSDGRWEQVV